MPGRPERSELERLGDRTRGVTTALHDTWKRQRPSELERQRRRIERMIALAGGNMKVAAAGLGVGVSTLYRWLPLYGIAPPRRREQELP